MRIVFATTQAKAGSTVIGRVMPLAGRFAASHEVHVLLLGEVESESSEKVSFRSVGKEPFTRSDHGKKRLSGIGLILNMLGTAWHTANALRSLRPDVVIIEKSLPSNVFGVWLWSWIKPERSRIALDVDDFELTANKLSSIIQRASIHWAERVGTKLADVVVTASPFLSDHFKQLAQHKERVHMIPTGISSVQWDCHDQPKVGLAMTYLGSVSKYSGHRIDLLPAIFKSVREKMPNAKLLIAGDGDDVAPLKAEFEKAGLGGAVEWLGRFTSRQIPQILSRTSLIIDPIDDSVAQRAKSSFRVSLAAVAGLPVVSSNIGVRPMFVPAPLHDRMFARTADIADYADKIVAWLQKPITSEESAMLKNQAEEYTWDNLAKIYERALLA